MTEYEEWREWLAERFRIARAEGMLRHAEGGYSDADEVLSDPRMAMLATKQIFPEMAEFGTEEHRIQKDYAEQMYADGFRRIVEKPKEESR